MFYTWRQAETVIQMHGRNHFIRCLWQQEARGKKSAQLWVKSLLAVNRTAPGHLLSVYKKNIEETHHFIHCITDPRCIKYCWSTERCHACCILPSQLFHWHSTSCSMCYIIQHKWCLSDGPTGTIQQEWDQVIVEATQLIQFSLSINLHSGYLNSSWNRKKNGQELIHIMHALCAMLLMILCPVVVVIIQTETVNRIPW
jgi:hypothetical protein